MASEECFAPTYEEARAKFLGAAAGARAATQSFRHPGGTSPSGAPLFVDVALIGAPGASRVLMSTSGTHGQEGFAGSAAQIQWLRGAPYRLEPGIAVLLIHAVNPWGWAHLSRTNENNVDLNRSFVDHEHGGKTHPLYDEINEIVVLDRIDPQILSDVWPRLMRLAERHGMQTLADALAGGQYDHPQGINYGGRTQQWSSSIVQAVASAYCQQATSVTLIDWHTGIGPFGEPFFMCFDNEGSAPYRHAAAWWGEERIRQGARELGDVPRPRYTGVLIEGLRRSLPHAHVAGAVIEFGTYPVAEMLQALIIDRWLRFHADPSSETARRWCDEMIERFYPGSRAWRARCREHAEWIYRRALQGLPEC